jgi:hypothetical protein
MPLKPSATSRAGQDNKSKQERQLSLQLKGRQIPSARAIFGSPTFIYSLLVWYLFRRAMRILLARSLSQLRRPSVAHAQTSGLRASFVHR